MSSGVLGGPCGGEVLVPPAVAVPAAISRTKKHRGSVSTSVPSPVSSCCASSTVMEGPEGRGGRGRGGGSKGGGAGSGRGGVARRCTTHHSSASSPALPPAQAATSKRPRRSASDNDEDDCNEVDDDYEFEATTAVTTTVVGGCEGLKKHVHVGGFTDASIAHLYDALSMIDPDKLKGWEQAKHLCAPHVLAHEACPCYFMMACQSNPWEAASRMCNYWNDRIDLFGEEKAFEALTIGSDDAPPTGLTDQDVTILETGCTQLLPADRQGRSVHFFNESLLSTPELYDDSKGRLRVLWYILQKGYTSGEAQAHRLVTVVLLVRPPRSGYNLAYSSACSKLAGALPVHVDVIHLLTLPASTGSGRIVQFAISAGFNFIGSFFRHLIKVHHGAAIVEAGTEGGGGGSNEGHEGKSSSKPHPNAANLDPQEHLVQQLRKHGLTKKSLPECVGGVVTAGAFQGWLKRQQRKEQQLFWSPAQRAQRRRDINRMHSRRKRQRRRQEFEELQDQVRHLEESNNNARDLYRKLQQLLQSATSIVQDAQWKNYPDIDGFGVGNDTNASTLVDNSSGGGGGSGSAHVTSWRDWSSLQSNIEHPGGSSSSNAAAPPPPLSDALSSILAALEPDPIPRSRCYDAVGAQPTNAGRPLLDNHALVRGYDAVFGDCDPSSSAFAGSNVLSHRNNQISQLPQDPIQLRSNALLDAYLDTLEQHESSSSSVALPSPGDSAVRHRSMQECRLPAQWSASAPPESLPKDWNISALLLMQQQQQQQLHHHHQQQQQQRQLQQLQLLKQQQQQVGLDDSSRFGASLFQSAAGHEALLSSSSNAPSFLHDPAGNFSLAALLRSKAEDWGTATALPRPLASDPAGAHSLGDASSERPQQSLSSCLWSGGSVRRPSTTATASSSSAVGWSPDPLSHPNAPAMEDPTSDPFGGGGGWTFDD